MESYSDNSHFFVKFFLLDDTQSLNSWGVSRQALVKNISSFIGKPFIIMPKFGHPTPESGDQMFDAQEPYRVGTIIETGIDRTTGKAWGVAEITDEKAKEIIKSGQIKFVSPSIVFHSYDMVKTLDGEIINDFVAAHVAGVKDPAFGMTKAMIKGQCSGDAHTCRSQLMSVQASVEKSVSPCGCWDIYEQADKQDCLQKCFHNQKESNLDVTDPQNIAICMSECNTKKSKSAKEISTETRNDLNDSDFAYVCNDGIRKLPIHDAAHTRNALARFSQTKGIPDNEKPKVLSRICSAAKKFGISSDLCESRSANTSIKENHEIKVNNMTDDEKIKSLSAELETIKKQFAEMKSAMDSGNDGMDDDQIKSKKKLFKQKSAGKNDPNALDTTGDNDYDDDDIDEDNMTPGVTSKGSDGVDDHQTNSKTKQKPSKTVAAMVEKLDRMEKEPIVNSILDAKMNLDLITTETKSAESDRLYKQPVEQLKISQAELTKLAGVKKDSQSQPFVRYSSAALTKDGRRETADDFISEVFL